MQQATEKKAMKVAGEVPLDEEAVRFFQMAWFQFLCAPVRFKDAYMRCVREAMVPIKSHPGWRQLQLTTPGYVGYWNSIISGEHHTCRIRGGAMEEEIRA